MNICKEGYLCTVDWDGGYNFYKDCRRWGTRTEPCGTRFGHFAFYRNLNFLSANQELISSNTQPESFNFDELVNQGRCHVVSKVVNKADSVHNLFLVYLSISTCFGRLCAHHQEKQLCLCDTWYLLFCVDDCLVCRVECFIPPCIPHRITSIKCRINTVVSPDDGHIVSRNM